MGNRNSTLLCILALVALTVPLAVVVILATAVQEEVDECAPDTGTVRLAGAISDPIQGQIGVAQANIPARARMAGFRRSMPRVLSSKPDLVSLNEQMGRSLRQIEAAAPGYEAYRDPSARGRAAGNVVLWEAARWDRAAAGQRVLVARGPQKWDSGRAATWVTLRGAGEQAGSVVSMVSTHHMINPAKYGPDRARRQRIYGQAMDRLTALIAQLKHNGPVFVAGDMNTHASQRAAGWSAAAKMSGAGYGWIDRGLDYIFFPQGGGIRPAESWSGPMASDHDWVAARFNINGAGVPGRAAPAARGRGRAARVATVAGLSPEQTRHASTIVSMGRKLGVAERGLVVAVATALQESGLRNLPGGDRDSLGLFQQRPSTGWGSPQQVRTPALAARAFFGRATHTSNTGLLDVAGWETMTVTAAAQAVQRSAFPSAYADDEDLARKIVSQLDPGAAATLAAATGPSYCAEGGVAISSSSCVPSDSPAENGLTPDALMVLRCVESTFGPHTFGGVGERASNSRSDHPAGRAVDVMIEDWSSARGVADGDAIAAWLQEHHRAFGITYLIWRGQIWSPGDQGWRPYSHPSGAADATSRHMDHVHISVKGNAGTGLDGAVSLPLPAGTYTDQSNWREGGSRWANWHSGNDLSAPCGTPVLAAHPGTVVIDRGQGWAGPALVKITQGPGRVTTWYAHMNSVTVQPGAQVGAGQQIGTVGDQGNSSGCHLHLELHLRNGSIYAADNTDPMPWISAQLGQAPVGTRPASN